LTRCTPPPLRVICQSGCTSEPPTSGGTGADAMMRTLLHSGLLAAFTAGAGWIAVVVLGASFEVILGTLLLWAVGASLLGPKEQARRAREAEKPGWGRYR
jgi:hypothetical protein